MIELWATCSRCATRNEFTIVKNGHIDSPKCKKCGFKLTLHRTRFVCQDCGLLFDNAEEKRNHICGIGKPRITKPDYRLLGISPVRIEKIHDKTQSIHEFDARWQKQDDRMRRL